MKKILLITLSFFMLTCADNFDENENKLAKDVRNTESLAAPINDFGFDLFRVLANCNDNVIISPLSIHCDLAMASNAVDDQTLTEMKQVMRINALADYNLAYKDLLTEINADNTKNLSLSNGLFYDEARLNLNLGIYDILNSNYFCEKNNYNFGNAGTVNLINQWAADKTNGRITEILEKIEDESSFLINAVYFKDDWLKGFDSKHTRKANFKNEDHTIANIDMMHTRSDIKCIISADYDAIDLPMKNENYSYTAIVPKTKSITEFIGSIAQEKSFTKWFDNNIVFRLGYQDLNLSLPKYKLPLHYDLNKSLMMIGMNDFFSKGLPLLSIPNSFNPIGNVTHDVYFDLNESGIEGAAVTTISTIAEVSPFHISFDRPFLFVLRNKVTNLPLFIGKVSKL